MLNRLRAFDYLLTTLFIATVVLAGCVNNTSGEASPTPLPTVTINSFVQPTETPSDSKIVTPIILSTSTPIVLPTPTPTIPVPFFDTSLDLTAGPVEMPLELQIPSLKVDAPVLGVGLIKGDVMDAPIGPVDDPVWHSAFWFRGSSIPGESGTATIGGHITDLLGEWEIFGHLKELRPGDLIIIHIKNTTTDIHFYVDKVRNYTIDESTDPGILSQIFGSGPILGKGPQPAPDGLSHLTLITCGGDFVDGKFNSRTVVYATRNEDK